MSEIAYVFLRLGFLGFGGPIAVIAMMEEEFATRRRWIDESHFSEIYTVIKLFPGPISTQMAIYLGRLRGGTLGGLVAGFVFILPSFLIVWGLSYLYVLKGGLGSSQGFLGFQIGALVVIIQSTLNMSRPYRNKWRSWPAALGSFILIYYFPRYEPLVLLGFGVLGVALAPGLVALWKKSGKQPKKNTAENTAENPVEKTVKKARAPRSWVGIGVVCVGGFGVGVAAALAAGNTLLLKLSWLCFKAGAFVFGSGLAIVPLLEADAVRHLHWLTHSQFMDGLALGQMTPGPVVITATFIGYFVAAFPGALVATVAIFLPSFINVYWILPRVWSRMSRSPLTVYFTGLAIPAVIGAIFATTFRLGTVALASSPAWALFLVGVALSQLTRLPGWLLIVGSGVIGIFFHS